MNPQFVLAMFDMILFLGQKPDKGKAEILLYNSLCGYAGEVARYNTMQIRDDMSRHEDEDYNAQLKDASTKVK